MDFICKSIGAVLTLLAAQLVIPALPYLLSFAAGAMLYVVVEELIPEMCIRDSYEVGLCIHESTAVSALNGLLAVREKHRLCRTAPKVVWENNGSESKLPLSAKI